MMEDITAKHISTDARYRSPQGAVVCGGKVSLFLELSGYDAMRCNAELRLWDGVERFVSGSHVDAGSVRRFRFDFHASDSAGILWYNFRIRTPKGLLYYGAADGALRSGRGMLTSEVPHDFRITVYDGAFTTPEWFRNAVVYQIFPDRFARGEHPGAAAAVRRMHELGRDIVVKRWDEEVDYLPLPDRQYYSPVDFYLGNLQGIIDAIPYLKSLGVTAVYLNPVFESPYNHRYSTGDYMKIDPLLGTEDDFRRMVDALHAAGIRVILDGVFSHTGDDSRYFNRYGRYDDTGAYQSSESPYCDWYIFKKHPDQYQCWWDFDTLPEVDELNPSYCEFIARVLEKWNSFGVDGWRLDVADELPDGFMRFLRRTLKELNPDALLIGEVWEDAATKQGLEGRRGYVNGDELDGVMNYPFADALIDFLLNRATAEATASAFAAQQEGYPPPFYAAQLGLLGSHDTVRIRTALSGAPDRNALSREAQAVWKPSSGSAELGRKRLLQASAVQFSMPFAPCIYYGDEAGLTGMADPFCRRPYPWGHEDKELIAHYRRLSKARSGCDALIHGDAEFLSVGRDVLVVRRSTKNSAAVTAINRAAHPAALELAVECGCYVDVITSAEYDCTSGRLELEIAVHGAVMLVPKV